MRKAPRRASKKDGGTAAPLDGAAARGRALKLLSRREHSAAELAVKLKRRGADAETARDAVQAMAEAGWQSDERYAEMLVRNRVGQGYGPLRIRMELQQAGVPDAQIRAALDAADIDWNQCCFELWQRRFGKTPAAAAEWQKQYRFLASRGFASQQIRAALKDARHIDADLPEDGLDDA